MTSIIAFILILGVLIFVHELGHFLTAKAMGVKVERFSLGFPPKAIGKKIGETEYVLSWLPIGGYVKMFGEHPDEEEEIPPDMVHRSFAHKPVWKRFLIVLAGPLSNFVFAVVVFWLIFAVAGVHYYAPEVGQVVDDMPAQAAGFQAGDHIVSIDGRPVKYWSDVIDRVRATDGGSMEVVVRRDGQTLPLTLTPKIKTVRNRFGEDQRVPMIGIVGGAKTITERVGALEAIGYGLKRTYYLTSEIIVGVYKMISGSVSARNLGGPIMIAQVTALNVQEGFGNLIFWAALLSVNLGIINLLPIPILDGGHLFFYVLEMIFRRPVSIRVRERAQQAGALVLLLFMLFVFYNDIARIFHYGWDLSGLTEQSESADGK
jgi:regulator of sigma E protease